MTTLFISHSSKDKTWAADVREALRSRGYQSLFLDSHPDDGIPAGAKWEQELWQRLRQSRGVVVLCTGNWLNSPWCVAEAMIARERGKSVFLLAATDIVDGRQVKGARDGEQPPQIPDFLKDTQFISLAGLAMEDALARLWRGLEEEGLKDDFPLPDQPYPGLEPFQESDAAVFFGRDEEIARVKDILNRRRKNNAKGFILVLGASGCGKSSLVRAGVLPRLKRASGEEGAGAWVSVPPFSGGQGLEGLDRSLALASKEAGQSLDLSAIRRRMEPASQGVSELALAARALREFAGELLVARGVTEGHVLLLLDQLEEVFGAVHGSEPHAMLRLLIEASANDASPVVVLATMRSDFLNAFQLFPGAAERYEEITLDPMPRSHFGELIKGPAQRFGLALGPGLTECLVEDARHDDALPLLAFTLERLYAKGHEDGVLTLEEYRDVFPPVQVRNDDGTTDEYRGVSAAIKHAADEIVSQAGYAKFPTDAPRWRDLRLAFYNLAQISEAGQFTRRTALWSQMPKSCEAVLNQFVSQRLLVSGTGHSERTLCVAHEALFRSWDRLVDWLKEGREFLLWRHRLRNEMTEWARNNYHETILLRGPVLIEAERWLGTHPDDLNSDERSFIHSSIQVRDQTKRRLRRIIITTIALLLILVLIALGAAYYAWNKKKLADQATERALMGFSKALALQADSESASGTSIVSLLLAREAANMHSSRETINIFNKILSSFLNERTIVVPGLDEVALFADGQWLAFKVQENLLLQPIDGSRAPLKIHGVSNFSISQSGDWGAIFKDDTDGDESRDSEKMFGPVEIWGIETDRSSSHLIKKFHYNHHNIAFDISNQNFVTNCEDNSKDVCLYELNQLEKHQPAAVRLQCAGQTSTQLNISDFDTWLAAVGDKGQLCLWRLPLTSGDKHAHIITKITNIRSVDIDERGNHMVLTTDKQVLSCDLKGAKVRCRKLSETGSDMDAAKLSPAGDIIAHIKYDNPNDGSGNKNGFTLNLIRVEDGKLCQSHYQSGGDIFEVYNNSDPFFLPKYGFVGYAFYERGNNATGQIKLISSYCDVDAAKDDISLPKILSKLATEQEVVNNEGVNTSPLTLESQGKLVIADGKIEFSYARDLLGVSQSIAMTDLKSGHSYPYAFQDTINSIIIIRNRYVVVTTGSIQGSGGYVQSESKVWLFDLFNLAAAPRVLLSYSGETFNNLSSSADNQHKLAVLRTDGSVFVFDTDNFDRGPVALKASFEFVPGKTDVSMLFSADSQFLILGSYNEIDRWDLTKPDLNPQVFFTQNSIKKIWTDENAGDLFGLMYIYENSDEMLMFKIDHRFFSDVERGKWLLKKSCSFPFGRNLTESEWATYFSGMPYRKTCPNWYIPATGANLLN